eukprot:915436-Rhodomonas_salina.2
MRPAENRALRASKAVGGLADSNGMEASNLSPSTRPSPTWFQRIIWDHALFCALFVLLLSRKQHRLLRVWVTSRVRLRHCALATCTRSDVPPIRRGCERDGAVSCPHYSGTNDVRRERSCSPVSPQFDSAGVPFAFDIKYPTSTKTSYQHTLFEAMRGHGCIVG